MIENKNKNKNKLVEFVKDNMPDQKMVNVSKTNDKNTSSDQNIKCNKITKNKTNVTVDIPTITYKSKNKLKLKGKYSKRNRYDNIGSNKKSILIKTEKSTYQS